MSRPKLIRRSWIVAGTIAAVACGGGGDGGSGPPSADSDRHLRVVVEPLPYDALKSGKFAFERVAISGLSGGAGLVVVDVNARRATTAHHGGLTWDLALSPDGSRIAYAAGLNVNSTTRAWDVFLQNVGSREETPIGGPGGSRGFPSWSPSGAEILYGESPNYGNGVERIMRQPPVAGIAGRTVLSDPVPVGCVLNSPASMRQDGALVFTTVAEDSRCSSTAALYLKRPGELVTLAQTPVGLPYRTLMSPVWSPAGDEVAFLERTAGTGGASTGSLAVKGIRPDGTGLRTIISVPDEQFNVAPRNLARNLCWLGGGTTLVFTVAESSVIMRVYAVNRDGTGLIKVTTDGNYTDRWVTCAT